MTPEKLAGLIFGAVDKRRNDLIPSVGNRVAAMVGHVAPRLVDAGMKKVMLDGLEDRVLVEGE